LNHALGHAINPQRPFPADANTLIFTSAFRGIADMAGPAAGFVTVENDPSATFVPRLARVPSRVSLGNEAIDSNVCDSALSTSVILLESGTTLEITNHS
jgi:hypothetical protein